MPSIAESKRKVRANLDSQPDVDHDAILASLEEEIDRHNAASQASGRDSDRKRQESPRADYPESATKFRFKSSSSDSRKRKHRSRRDDEGHRHRHRKQRRDSPSESGAAHPFPREPTEPDREGQANSNTAFRESLFDALADDEGAAYWESVYSQPIHVYERPTVKTAKGGLEEMNDDQYAAYVQTKMWEKQNPHIVRERERAEKKRKEEEEERTRRREEFIRRKERAAWERAERDGARKFAGVNDDKGNDYEYVFDFSDMKKSASKRSTDAQEYRQAWTRYASAWDRLKLELLDEAASQHQGRQEPSKRIPWPVLQHKPVTKPNIEDFLRHIPAERDGKSKLQLLKVERVRWHPDKVQQRFGGHVDEGTMKLVTGVFQVVDGLVDAERQQAT